MAVNWVQLAAAVAPLIGGMIAGKKGKQSAEQAAGGMRMQDMMPQIQALMAQQLAQSQQHYGYQQQKYAANQPIQDALRAATLNLTPNHLKTSMPMAQPQAPSQDDLLGGFEQRGGGTGGAWKGAASGAGYGSIGGPIGMGAGAVIGGIVGAAKKKAKTAPTDFKVQDAQSAIANAIQAYQGRQADPAEIMAMIQGQGWEQGDRWVGDQSLRYILNQLQRQGRG
jgi:hypothetical protein